MSTFSMAWRNIWRNRRRTLSTITAMVVAVFITIGYSGLVAGMLVQLESDTLDFELGAAQIFAPGYQDRPSIYSGMADSDAIVERLEAAGLVATSRLLGGGLIAHADASAGALIRGVDLTREPRTLALSAQVREGRWLGDDEPRGVVLGRKLAHTLGVKPGDELVMLGQATDGSMANELFTVRGVLKGVGSETDAAGVFMSAAAFRALLAYEGGAHQIIVKRVQPLDTVKLMAQVDQAAPGQDTQSWKEINPTIATMLESVGGLIGIFFFIINVAIAIVVLNAMLMAVFERIREFGVLKALGIGPGAVLRLIYLEALLQVLVAIGVGVILSIPVMWYLSTTGISMGSVAGTDMMGMAMMDTWYAVLSPQIYVQPVVMTVLVVSLAVMYPAWKAARIQPVEAMRHQ